MEEWKQIDEKHVIEKVGGRTVHFKGKPSKAKISNDSPSKKSFWGAVAHFVVTCMLYVTRDYALAWA